MLNQKYDFQISKLYAASMFVLVIASCVLVLLQPLLWFYKVILLVTICSYAFYIYWYFIFLQAATSIIGLHYYDVEWFALTNTNKIPVKLVGFSSYMHLITILKMQAIHSKQQFRAIIFCDSLTANYYRRLQVNLLF